MSLGVIQSASVDLFHPVSGPPDASLVCGQATDILDLLPAGCVQACVTSPPYFGLRDYGVEGQLGMEATPGEYIASLVKVFRSVKRVLKDDGTLWLNIGDSYSAQAVPSRGIKQKDLIGIPWMLAFALRADGWYLRQDIIWHKPNAMPESVTDRCTKAHEYVFLLSKGPRYFYDHESAKEPAVSDHPAGNKTHKYADQYEAEKSITQQHRTKAGLKALAGVEWTTRNRRSVWSVNTKPYKAAHFATFPTALIEPCVLAGSRPFDLVLDPFSGSGTTGLVARTHGRYYIGCDLNPEYIKLSEERLGP